MRAMLLSLAAALVLGPLAVLAGEKPPELTDDQCREFAKKIETSMCAGDPQVFDAAFDVNEKVTRAISGLQVPPEVEKEFRAGVAGSLKLGAGIVKSTKGTGSYKLLRIRRTDGAPRAVFRLLTSNEDMNYYELFLEPAAGGGVRIVDYYIYSTGEPMSQTLRRGCLPAVAQANRGALAKLMGWEDEYVKNLPAVQEMLELARTGKFKESLAAYRRLPEGLQKDKTLLLVKIQAALGLYRTGGGDQEYVAALADFQKHHPGDAGLNLMLIDFHFRHKEYDKAFESIENLDKSLGGDPFLKVMRGKARLAQDKLDDAEKFYQQALQEEPDLMPASCYDGLLTVSLKRKDFKETARLLTKLETDLELNLVGQLKDIPAYAEFLKSPEGAKWAAPPSAPPAAPAKPPEPPAP